MSTVAGSSPKDERPARFHHPVNDVAGLVLLLVLGGALGLELGRNPVPPLFVAAGCVGIVFVLGLAIVRYDWAVALGILLMPVVRQEPAPVDAVLAIVMAVTVVTDRLELRRVPLSMLTLCMLFIGLNLLSSMEAIESNVAAKYLAVTAYCLFIGIWICGYVNSPRRARLVMKTYIISAVAIAVASSVALYVRYPGSTILLSADYERARGFFKDANVYGPVPDPGGAVPGQRVAAAAAAAPEPADPDLLLRLPRRRHPVLVLPRRVAEPGRRDRRHGRSPSPCAAAARGARSCC